LRVQERLRGVAAACAERGLAEPIALEVAMDGAKAALAVDQWTDASVTAVCAYLESLAGGEPAPQDSLSRPRLVLRASA